MAVDVRDRLATPAPRVSLRSRIYGFGSVYAKTLRDSRLTFLIIAGLLGGIMFAAVSGVANVYTTPQSRQDIARLAADIPAAFQGLTGPAVGVDFAVDVFLVALASGAVAFVLSPFLGRGGAAGVAGAVMFAGFIVNGYQSVVPAFRPLANLTWFSWTASNLPLTGRYDWGSLVPV